MSWAKKKAALIAAMTNEEACTESLECMEEAKSLGHFLKLFGKRNALDWLLNRYQRETAGFLQENYPFVAAGIVVADTTNYSDVDWLPDGSKVECSYWQHYDLAWNQAYKLMDQKDGLAFLVKCLLSGAEPY